MGTIAVNRGRVGEAILPGLRAASPHEQFVLAGPGEPVPLEADVLVTLLEVGDDLGPLLAPSIKWVHVLGAGVDGFPFDKLGDRVLTCSRGAGAIAIAEWVLATMLAFEKRLPESWITAPPDVWNLASLGGLRGRTLGLVGTGAIGVEIARRAIAFDMRVIAVRRTDRTAPLPEIELSRDLDHLMAISDHLVVAAPATPATEKLLDADALGAAKPGLHLVNISRGSLVDQVALLAALDDGRVARASLDVVTPEPLPAGHPFYDHLGVRLSPHISWSSPDTWVRTFSLFVDNLQRWRTQQPLEGVVDPVAGY